MSDLRRFQKFRGTLSIGEHSLPVRFKTRIGRDGEVELDLHAFRITKASWFVREQWNADQVHVPEFVLQGIAEDGLRFESDSLSFNRLGERFSGIHDRHWSKPQGEFGKALFIRKLEASSERTALRLHLKGFACFPRLHATCPLGKITVAGATKLDEVDDLSGWIAIEAHRRPEDAAAWRAEADRFAEHIRRLLSFAASTMLQAPVLEFVDGDRLEVEILSQTRQHAPLMRVFHKLDQQGLLDAAVASFFEPRIKATNIFFAIEWFAMPTTYNEVRLVNAMTALENLIDSNLTEDEAFIQPVRSFEKTRRTLRGVIRKCLDKWPPVGSGDVRKELGEKLIDLNRRSLHRKLLLLAERWQVPLAGISDEQIRKAIRARNSVVHTGRHSQSGEDSDLWDDMTIVRELVVRFLLTAIGYQGQYLSHVGGYHFAPFPPEVPASEASSD